MLNGKNFNKVVTSFLMLNLPARLDDKVCAEHSIRPTWRKGFLLTIQHIAINHTFGIRAAI